MSNIVLKCENVSKYYKLGQYNNGTFFKDLQSWMAIKKGKEDPNARIGERVKSGEGFWALHNVDFEIEQGQRVGIIGKNGAGKSTLLKLISEITTPTTGNIFVKGRVASLLEVGTGFHPEMTGRENIYLNGAILGMKRSEINEKINDIIEFSEIEEHIDTPVKRYSSGMYVRLAFAVAAHLDSEILIADEVLAVGDAAFQEKALGKMNDISTHQGRTVLFVSHNMSAVRSLCNTGILLEDGKLTLKGKLDDVIDKYFDNPFLADDEKIEDKIKRLPIDSSLEILDITISQNGMTCGSIVGNADAIMVEVVYEVKNKEPGMRIYIDICDSTGELLFRTFNDGEEKGMSSLDVGKYKSTLIIPENLLGPCKYIMIIRGTVFNVRSCTGDGVRIPLNVVQNGLYNRAYPGDTFRGKLGIVLKWCNEKL